VTTVCAVLQVGLNRILTLQSLNCQLLEKKYIILDDKITKKLRNYRKSIYLGTLTAREGR
jgi:hypothetical protein